MVGLLGLGATGSLRSNEHVDVRTTEETAKMNRTRIRRSVPATHRNGRPSLSPYYMDETAFTLSDIRRDRGLETSPAER